MSIPDVIPLFPLQSVLFPRGRLPLQIFETRYIDLVKRVMQTDTGFGVCLLKEGRESALAGLDQKVHRIGTYARIVDWEALPNGLLGITAEGVHKFSVQDCWAQDDQLLMAKVAFADTDYSEQDQIPVAGPDETLVQLLQQLMKHPAIERLKLTVNYANLREIGWRLSELLPIPSERRQALLELDDARTRARAIEELLALMTSQA
jgi:uncharacterized protein